jgi:hypothetical protein
MIDERRMTMFAKFIYRGLPTAVLLAVAAIVQALAIGAFI